MKNEIEMIIIQALEGANSGFTEIAAREIKKAIKMAQKEGYQQAIDALNERHQSLKQGAFPTPASYLEGFESAQYFLDYKKKEIMK